MHPFAARLSGNNGNQRANETRWELIMADELERQSQEKDVEQVSMDEIEAEGATALPNKEVMSLLNVDANVDLGLDLAAPVDLAVAANLNVAAPIEAAASANLLSANAEAVAIAQQHGVIDQGISGSAEATAPQTASIDQSNDVIDAGNGAPATGAPAEGGAAAPTAGGVTDGATGAVGGVTDGVGGAVDGATGGATDGVTDGVGGAVGGVTDGAGGAVGGVTDGAGGAVGGVTDGVGGSVDGVTGGVDSLLNGGSLLDANVDINADADLTAPVAGAVAANANVAAPINASVAANIGSDGAVAQSLADQQVDIHQNLDDVSAEATADQDASIEQ